MSKLNKQLPDVCPQCGETVATNGRCENGHPVKADYLTDGYGELERSVSPHSQSNGKIYVPADWKRVVVIRRDKPEEEKP